MYIVLARGPYISKTSPLSKFNFLMYFRVNNIFEIGLSSNTTLNIKISVDIVRYFMFQIVNPNKLRMLIKLFQKLCVLIEYLKKVLMTIFNCQIAYSAQWNYVIVRILVL